MKCSHTTNNIYLTFDKFKSSYNLKINNMQVFFVIMKFLDFTAPIDF